MNYYDPRMRQGYGPMLGQNEGGFMPQFLNRPMQTGGALPPSGYDGNPGGMYTGGNFPAQQMPGMGTGGPQPPQVQPPMQTGGNAQQFTGTQAGRLMRLADSQDYPMNRLGGRLR